MKTTYVILREAVDSYKDRYFSGYFQPDNLTVADFIASAANNTACMPKLQPVFVS